MGQREAGGAAATPPGATQGPRPARSPRLSLSPSPIFQTVMGTGRESEKTQSQFPRCDASTGQMRVPEISASADRARARWPGEGTGPDRFRGPRPPGSELPLRTCFVHAARGGQRPPPSPAVLVTRLWTWHCHASSSRCQTLPPVVCPGPSAELVAHGGGADHALRGPGYGALPFGPYE